MAPCCRTPIWSVCKSHPDEECGAAAGSQPDHEPTGSGCTVQGGHTGPRSENGQWRYPTGAAGGCTSSSAELAVQPCPAHSENDSISNIFLPYRMLALAAARLPCPAAPCTSTAATTSTDAAGCRHKRLRKLTARFAMPLLFPMLAPIPPVHLHTTTTTRVTATTAATAEATRCNLSLPIDPATGHRYHEASSTSVVSLPLHTPPAARHALVRHVAPPDGHSACAPHCHASTRAPNVTHYNLRRAPLYMDIQLACCLLWASAFTRQTRVERAASAPTRARHSAVYRARPRRFICGNRLWAPRRRRWDPCRARARHYSVHTRRTRRTPRALCEFLPLTVPRTKISPHLSYEPEPRPWGSPQLQHSSWNGHACRGTILPEAFRISFCCSPFYPVTCLRHRPRRRGARMLAPCPSNMLLWDDARLLYSCLRARDCSTTNLQVWPSPFAAPIELLRQPDEPHRHANVCWRRNASMGHCLMHPAHNPDARAQRCCIPAHSSPARRRDLLRRPRRLRQVTVLLASTLMFLCPTPMLLQLHTRPTHTAVHTVPAPPRAAIVHLTRRPRFAANVPPSNHWAPFRSIGEASNLGPRGPLVHNPFDEPETIGWDDSEYDEPLDFPPTPPPSPPPPSLAEPTPPPLIQQTPSHPPKTLARPINTSQLLCVLTAIGKAWSSSVGPSALLATTTLTRQPPSRPRPPLSRFPSTLCFLAIRPLPRCCHASPLPPVSHFLPRATSTSLAPNATAHVVAGAAPPLQPHDDSRSMCTKRSKPMTLRTASTAYGRSTR